MKKITSEDTRLNPEDIKNHTMRMPICFLIEDSVKLQSYVSEITNHLREFLKEFQEDNTMSHSLEICIMSFNQKTTTIRKIKPLYLYDDREHLYLNDIQCSNSNIPKLGHAILRAISILKQCEREYEIRQINSYQPCLIIFGSGDAVADDELKKAISTASSMSQSLTLCTIPVLIGSSNCEIYKQISADNVYYHADNGLSIGKIFDAVKSNITFLSSSSSRAYGTWTSSVVEWDELKGKN